MKVNYILSREGPRPRFLLWSSLGLFVCSHLMLFCSFTAGNLEPQELETLIWSRTMHNAIHLQHEL